MEAFRTAAEAKDMDAVASLLADDVVFRSPIVFAPYHGRAVVGEIVKMAGRVLEDLHYVRELSGDSGRSSALVFRARIGELEVEGCDFIHLDEDGLIDELFVMVRPLSGAHALMEGMRVLLGEAGAAGAGA